MLIRVGRENPDAVTLGAILDAADEAVILLDQDATILLANSAARGNTGMPPQDPAGAHCCLLHPMGSEQLRNSVRHVIETGEPLQFEEEREGTWFLLRLKPIRDAQGRITSAALFSRDISATKKAEHSFQAIRERLQLAVQATHAGIWESDLSAGEMSGLEGVTELFGVTAEEAENGGWFHHVHPDDRERLVTDIETADRGDGMWDSEFRIVCRDGSIRSTVSKGTLVTAPDGTRKVLAVTQDVTEQRDTGEKLAALNVSLDERVAERTTELEEAIREQESFSYSVSHDLRAPLRHINCYRAILSDSLGEAIPDEASQCIERIKAATERMGHLIDHLLQLSRLSGKAVTHKSVDLSELATDIASLLQRTEESRKVRFVIQEGMVAKCDPILIRQLLENLLNNAWKYTSGRSPSVIEFGREKIGGRPIFFIRDNGVGFDMAYSNKLFKAFERLHGAEFEGSGVGLATAQKIVSRHGGKIWAEGKMGEGAIFYFTLSPKTHLSNAHNQCRLIL